MSTIIKNRSNECLMVDKSIGIVKPKVKIEFDCTYNELVGKYPNMIRLEKSGHLLISEDADIEIEEKSIIKV